MLSIANVKAVQAANYYERDDYYIRSLDEQDRWQGQLRTHYSNQEYVTPDDFNRALHTMPNPGRAAFDLTFSAPKSVSIVMTLTAESKADMLQAHSQAVKETLKEIEANEIEARITQYGVTQRVKTGNLAAAKFTHYVSRNQDMQLHTHCVVLNRTDYMGKTYAISNENLYKNHILYGQLYRNRLAKNLLRMGYSCTLVDPERGFFELEGVDKETLQQFSSRRAEIVEKLKVWNADSAAAADRATLLTRKAKENKDYSMLEQSWRAQIDDSLSVSKAAEAIRITPTQKHMAFQEAVKRLEEKQFAFSRRELERAVLAAGCIAGMNREDFTKHLERSDLILLGRLKNDDGEVYFTTIRNKMIEAEISANIRYGLFMPTITQAKEKLEVLSRQHGFTLNYEQTTAALHIATSQEQYIAVQGLAGTGKTYSLNAIRELYEREGWTVYGASFTGKAASELETDSRIKSTTLHSFLNNLEKEAGNQMRETDGTIKTTWDFKGLRERTKPEVWVIDEAGLTDNNILVHVQRAAKLAKAKVVLVGDYQQLAPVGVGNAYSNLVQSQTIKTCYLTDIRRQQQEDLLIAVKESVSGSIHKSFELLSDSIKEIPNAKKRLREIAKEYTSLPEEQREKTIVLTAKNKDRNLLNEQIREGLLKSGSINQDSEKEFTIVQGPQREEVQKKFTINEKIIFTENNHTLGIMNGTVGKIQSIREDQIVVETKEQTVVIHPSRYNHFDYGYCVTSYKAQGMTLDRAIIHIDSEQKALNTRNSYYVNISRAKHAVTIYTDNTEKICRQVNSWVKKITTDDFLLKQENRFQSTVQQLKKSISLIGTKIASSPHTLSSKFKSYTRATKQEKVYLEKERTNTFRI